jgi:hypothetical protein
MTSGLVGARGSGSTGGSSTAGTASPVVSLVICAVPAQPQSSATARLPASKERATDENLEHSLIMGTKDTQLPPPNQSRINNKIDSDLIITSCTRRIVPQSGIQIFMPLFTIGISHHTAPIEIREKVAPGHLQQDRNLLPVF